MNVDFSRTISLGEILSIVFMFVVIAFNIRAALVSRRRERASDDYHFRKTAIGHARNATVRILVAVAILVWQATAMNVESFDDRVAGLSRLVVTLALGFAAFLWCADAQADLEDQEDWFDEPPRTIRMDEDLIERAEKRKSGGEEVNS